MADEVILPEDPTEAVEAALGGTEDGKSLPERGKKYKKTGLSTNNQSDAEFMRATALMNRFIEARNARTNSGIEDEWAEAERLYNQEDDSRVEGEWRSDAFVPHATRETHNATPHLVSAILDSDQLVSITATSPSDEDYAKLEERIIEFQLEQKMQFPDALEIWAKQTVMLGTSCVFVGFKIVRVEKEFVEQVQVAANITAPRKQKRMVPIDAFNTISPLDITDIWVDPSSTPLRVPRLWYYERKSIRQMQASGIPYKNLDKLPEYPMTLREFFRTDFSSGDAASIGSRREQINSEMEDMDREDRLHHLIHEWDDEKKCWSVVADGDIEILEKLEFDTLPFVFSHYEFLNTRFYGRGVIAGIAKSCRNANRLRRQRDDNVELCLNKMMIVRSGAIVDEQSELIWRPGGVVHARGGSLENVMHVLEMGDVTQSAYADERIIKDDIEQVNGISNIAAGKSDAKSKTATGTSILRQMAVLRLRGPVRHMLQSMLKVVSLMIANNKKWLPQIEKEHLLGPSARLYRMYDFKGDRKVTLSIHPANLYDNKEVKTGQLLNAINILGKLGMLQTLDQTKLTKLILKQVGDVEDTDSLFTTADQMYTAPEFMAVLLESQQIVQAGQAAAMEGKPAEEILPQPTDNDKAHIAMHEQFQQVNPETAPLLVPHIQAHKMQQEQKAMQQAGMLPMMPPGGAGNGVNPRQLPQATTTESAVRTAANQGGAAAGRPSESLHA